MSLDFLLDMAWKSLFCAAAALLLLRLCRDRSAAEKSLLAHCGLVAALGLPLATSLVPPFAVEAPPAFAGLFKPDWAPDAAIVLAADPLPAVAAGSVTTEGPPLLLLLYFVPAGLLLLAGLVALARLHRLRRRAAPLAEPAWLAALDAARLRHGFRREISLLASADVGAPISWGLVRLVILVDPRTAAEPAHAGAVLAHELAHFRRLDWPALLVARLVTALFWFNPLLWLLARQAQDFSEQAADDVVLRSDIAGADYADLLVDSARGAAPLLLAANGLASGSSLGRRVLAALDSSRRRAPAHAGWWLAALAGGLSAGASLAAVDPRVKADPVIAQAPPPPQLASAERVPARPPAATAAPGRAKTGHHRSCPSHRHRVRAEAGRASGALPSTTLA